MVAEPLIQQPTDSDVIDYPVKRSPAETAYGQTIDVDPDHAAQVLGLSKTLDEHPAFIENNLESAKKAAEMPTSDYFAELEKKYPMTHAWVAEPKNMAVAKDDIHSITAIEDLVNGWKIQNNQSKRGELWAARLKIARETGNLTADNAGQIEQLAKEYAPLAPIAERMSKGRHILYNFAMLLPTMTRPFMQPEKIFDDFNPLDSAGPAVRKGVAGAAAGLTVGAVVGSIVPAAGTAAGAAYGAKKGAKLGVIGGLAEYAYDLEAGLAFEEYVGLKDSSGKKINVKSAADAAHSVGLVNAALETAGDLILLKLAAPIGKAAGSMITQPAMKIIAKTPGGAKLASIISSKPQVFAGMTLGKAIREAGKLWATGMVSEPVTEYAQEVMTGLGKNAAKVQSGQFKQEELDSLPDIFSEATGVISPTMQGMVVLGGLSFGSHIYNAKREMAKANANKEVYLKLGEVINSSKLNERLKPAAVDMVDHVVKGTPLEYIYTPATDFETYFQSKKIDPQAAAEELGLLNEYKAALEQGDNLKIPVKVFADKIAATEHYYGLADDIKFSPDHMTTRQAKEHAEYMDKMVKQAEESMRVEVEKASKENPTWSTGRQKVYDEMLTQIQESGAYSEEKAKANAEIATRIIESVASTKGKAEGIMDPSEFFSRYPVRIIDGKMVPQEPLAYAALRQGSPSDQELDKAFGKVVDDVATGKIVRDVIPTGRTSSVLQAAGAKDLPLVMPASVVEKARGHQISVEDVKRLPQELRDPIMVFASETEKNSLVALTEIRDVKGQSAIAAVHLGVRAGRYEVNKIASLYAKDSASTIGRWMEQGRLRYWDQERATPWLQSAGLETSTGEGIKASTKNIRSKADFVKAQEEQKLRQSAIDKTNTPEFKKWFGGSKVVDENGGPLVVYHGSGNAEGIGKSGFSYEFIDKGNDQLGSGFYFTNSPETASGYTSRRLTPEQEKIGGETSPAVLPVYLSIKKPIEVESGKGITSARVRMTSSQLKKIVMKAPDIKNPDGPLSNWGDVRADGFGKVLNESLENYDGETFNAIGNDFFPGESPAFLKAVNEVLGYDGVVTTFPTGEKHYVAWFPEQIKSTFNRGTFDTNSPNILFQGDPETNPRASISFKTEETLIRLFRGKSDASSLPHELAHYWLKNFHEFILTGKGSEQNAADWKILSDWLNISENQKHINEAQQEKFAKSFETFLMEGKAPSVELAGVFAKFKRWLSALYRHMIPYTDREQQLIREGWLISKHPQLNVEVSPYVQDVMKRIIASEDEIAYAEQQVGIDVIGDKSKLSPEVEKKLVDIREKATQEAEGELLRRQLKELTDRATEEYQASRSKEEQRIRKEVEGLPAQKALEATRRAFKKNPADIAKAYLDNKLNKEDKMSFRVISGMQGYPNAAAMANDLTHAQPADVEIATRLENAMKAFEPLTNKDNLREKAMEIIHSDLQTELLARERELFLEMVDQAEGRARDVSIRRAARVYDARMAKERAIEIIGSKPANEAIQFMPYFTAERNAAMKADQAAADGKFQVAADEKQKQMLNHALATEAYRVRRQVEAWARYVNGVRTKKKELFKKEEHFNQVAEILGRMGIGRTDYDPSTKVETLREYVSRMTENQEAVNIPDWLMDESRSLPFREWKVTELADLVNALKNIQHLANAEHAFYRIMKGATLENTLMNLREAAETNAKARPADLIMRRDNAIEKIKKAKDSYFANIRTPENIALMLDGWQDDGPWQRALWAPVEEAGDAESSLMREINDGLTNLLETSYSKEERKNLVDGDLVYVSEWNQELDRMHLLMLALNLGNEGNRKRLFDTRIVGVDETMPWNEATVISVLEKNLTANDLKFVQGVWDLMHSLWPKSSAVHLEMTGFTPEGVEPTPFDLRTKDGEVVHMNGGYFPLSADTRTDLRSKLGEMGESPLYTEHNPAWKATTRTGHLKARVSQAKYPVALDSSIIVRHLRDVVHDIAFRPTVIDLRRLVLNQEFSSIVRAYAGDANYNILREWISSVATGGIDQSKTLDVWDRLMRWARTNMASSIIVFNMKIVTQNVSNIFLYAKAVDGFTWRDVVSGYFQHGIGDYVPNSLLRNERAKQIRELVYEKSPFMRDKKQNYDYSLAETMASKLGKDHKVKEFFRGLMGASDELTSIPMWLTAYEKARGMLMDEKESVAYADRLIRRSIGAARKYQTAAIFRGSETAKTFAFFYGFFSAQQQRWERERGVLAKDYIKNSPRFLGYIAAHFIAFPVASNIASFNFPNVDDEDELKRWLKSLLLNRFQMLPGINMLSSAIADDLLGIKSFGYRPIAQVAVGEKMIDAVRSAVKASRGDGEVSDAVEAISHAMAYATGNPDQFVNMFWNAYDMAVKDMKPKAEDLIRRRRKNERTE